MIDYKKLETDGYLVIPNFLNSNEVNEILNQFEIYKEQFNSTGPDNKNYNVIYSDLTESLTHKAQTLVDNINKETNIKLSGFGKKLENLDSSITKFGWHQDHEVYYTYQDAYNCVHFWIPIVKPDITQTGIDVIPHTRIEKALPELYQKNIKAKGAKRFLLRPPRIEMHDDETGELIYLDFDFDTIKETPNVGSGDLILLRGDTIHRSQIRTETTPWRLSVAFWAFNLEAELTKERFYRGCEMKRFMIKNNPKAFEGIAKAFDSSDTLIMRDFL